MRDEVQQLLDSAEHFVVWDYEATSTDIFSARIHGAALANEQLDSAFILADEISEAAAYILERNLTVLVYNGSYDIGMSKANGVPMFDCYEEGLRLPQFIDVYSAVRLYDERWVGQGAYKLDAVLGKLVDSTLGSYKTHFHDYMFAKYGDREAWASLQMDDPDDLFELSSYAQVDAVATMLLWIETLQPALEEMNMLGLLDMEDEVGRILVDVNFDGMVVDCMKLLEFKEKVEAILYELKQRLDTYTKDYTEEVVHHKGRHGKGGTVGTYEEWTVVEPVEINLSSSTDIGKIFHKLGVHSRVTTKGGKESWGAEALEAIDHPFADVVRDYRAYFKLLNTYIDPWLEKAAVDGRLHPKFNQVGTTTGRMSCIAEGQPVLTTQGWKPIENIQVGDLVYSMDGESVPTPCRVLKVLDQGYQAMMRLTWVERPGNRQGVLLATPDHRVRTKGGRYFRMDELQPDQQLEFVKFSSGGGGSVLTYPYGSIVGTVNHRVVSVEIVKGVADWYYQFYKCYDLVIEDYPNFVVNEIVVHNCSEPNLQQIPKDAKSAELDEVDVWVTDLDRENEALYQTKKQRAIAAATKLAETDPADLINLRLALVADNPSQTLIKMDYVGMEIAMFAHLCEDENMIQAYASGKDIHWEMAKTAFGLPDIEWHDAKDNPTYVAARRQSKTLTFGLLFCIGNAKLAVQLGMTEEQAKEVKNIWFEGFPNARPYMNKVMRDVKRVGYIETFAGRRRRLYSDEAYKGINAIVQGSCADIVKLSIIEIYNQLWPDGILKLQVHDELVVQCAKDRVEEIAGKMENIMTDFDLNPRLLVDWSANYSYGAK